MKETNNLICQCQGTTPMQFMREYIFRLSIVPAAMFINSQKQINHKVVGAQF